MLDNTKDLLKETYGFKENTFELYERALKAKTKLARNTLLRKSADLLGFDTIADLLDFFTIL